MTKICKWCYEEKPIEQFNRNKAMPDGRINKCKACVYLYEHERLKRNSADPKWIEKERARGREKYHRLNYKETNKTNPKNRETWVQKYPEKELAYRACGKLKKDKGLNIHHWSYNEEHYLDVIPLTIADHNLLHRYMKYDQDVKMYRNLQGELLSNKESHIELLASIKLLE